MIGMDCGRDGNRARWGWPAALAGVSAHCQFLLFSQSPAQGTAEGNSGSPHKVQSGGRKGLMRPEAYPTTPMNGKAGGMARNAPGVERIISTYSCKETFCERALGSREILEAAWAMGSSPIRQNARTREILGEPLPSDAHIAHGGSESA